MIQDLCSHRVLIREANEDFYSDKSPEHMDVIQNFEELVDKIKAVLQEKVVYIEKSVEFNQDKINQLQGEVVQFIRDKIIKIVDQKKLQMVHPTADIDEMIRENFMLRTRNRIHYKVMEYLYKATQILIQDQQSTISSEDLIVLLRFMDCVTMDPSAIYEEIRGLSSLRHDYTKSIVELADQTSDLRIFKLAASVLSNAQTQKAWPVKLNSLFSKYIFLSDIGDTLLLSQLSPDFNLSSTISFLQTKLTFQLDFVPSKSSSDFNFLTCQDGWVSHGEEAKTENQDLLSSINQKEEKKKDERTTAIVCLDIDLNSQIQQIESTRMQETVTLREVAEKILDEEYNKRVKELVEKEKVVSLEKFKEQYGEYYKECVAYIEVRLILSKSVKDEESFNLVIECAIQALKRVFQREEYVYNLSPQMASKVKNLDNKLTKLCIAIIMKGQKDEKFTSHCISILQALRQGLRKIKDSPRGPNAVAQCKSIKNLMGSDEDNSFLIDILTQISNIETCQEIPNLKYQIEDSLIKNHRFQSQIWQVAQQVYEILSSIIRQHLPSVSAEAQQKFLKQRKDIELQAQKTLLNSVSLEGSNLLISHNLDVLRLIVHTFIRSAWVLEGIVPNADGQQSEDQNMQSLITLTSKMVQGISMECFYKTNSGKIQVLTDDIVLLVHFLVRRLTVDNRGPNHPASYDQAILESNLFKKEVFGKIMEDPLEVEEGETKPNRCARSKLKTAFISCLGAICSNDPAQIPKVIEKGLMKQVAETLKKALPVHKRTNYVLLDFLRVLVVHEKGRMFIKDSGLFELVMNPCVLNLTDTERKGDEKDKNNMSYVIISSNQERHKMHAHHAMSGLVRSTDPYFQETAIQSVKQIIEFIAPKAKSLQKVYYDHLAFCQQNSISKRRFQTEVTEKLISRFDYHAIKFEIEKIHTLSYAMTHDVHSLMQFMLKVFNKDTLNDLFEVFEIISTIKPAYDFVQRGTANDRQGSPFFLFTQIFSTILFRAHEGRGNPAIDVFEQRLRAACKNLSDVFSDLGKPTLKKIDLVDFMKFKDGTKIPEICSHNKAMSNIDPSNLRGNLIASVLIVGQYITIFESTRKTTQESLCVTKAWSSELSILSGFMTSFNECNHKITDAFFRDQQNFIDMGVVTKSQIKEISIDYTKELTQEQKEKFAENRKQIEENIDMHRENLTYLDPDFINIQRLLQIVWDYWRAPNNRNGRLEEGQITESKKAYTELTIDNIKDLDPVIADFERLRGNINSTEFLTTISRIYTYISELQQLIINEKLCGITFYEFVQKGCLSQLIKIFNIVKTISIKKQVDKIKFIAVDCIQSINRQLKSVLTQFISCSPQLVAATAPTMPNLIKDAGLYDSPQHFFANYMHNLVQQLVLEGPNTEQPEEKVALYEDKNLRQVQVLLLHNIASGFEKCKYLKDEHGGNLRDSKQEKSKPKKPHHDENQIAAITAMGFDEAIAKKALKATGDVSNAVTLLLESSFNLDGVSSTDSEEEKQPSDEQLKNEEEAKKKAEQEQEEMRKSLITVEQFKEFVKVAQEKGLDAVSGWSTFTPEQAKIIPLKTQRKYLDLYDQYVISLARSPNQSQDELIKIFDKIYSEYALNVSKVESSSSLSIDQITALFQDTKNKLSLLHRLTKIEYYDSMLKSKRKDSFTKLIENVVKTIKAITSSQVRQGVSDRQTFYYVSNMQELLYKSLLLLLVYLQTLNSKIMKYENSIIEHEKKGSGEVTTKKAKLKNHQKKMEDFGQIIASYQSQKFQEKLGNIKLSRKYAKELTILSGQIEDISRSILLQVDSPASQIPSVTKTMTSGTSTINIIQIQKMAFNEQRIQNQIEDIIKKMLEVRARKILQFNKKEDEEIPEIQQKDCLIDFKTFIAEFHSQVLGIGKGPALQNQNRWGGQSNNLQQYLSQPSNELANQQFTKIFRKAISTTCDLIVKQNKSQEKEELLKGQNLKETLTTSKIQLKPEILDELKTQKTARQATNNDDAFIYKTILSSLSASTEPWYEELTKSVPCVGDFEIWKELSLLELRNLSNLTRVYIDQESGIIKEMIEGENILEWFRLKYLPLRLVKRIEEEKNVKYELEQSTTIEQIDKNVCLFLNEITGYGHLYNEKAKDQRIFVRHRLLTSCLESLQNQAQNPVGIQDLTVLQQAQLVSCLMIIQHLINQYNQFEYNRVLLSRECYESSIKMLFTYSGSMRFVQIINSILGQVIKIPGQNFSTLLIERSFKIFTTIALFLEGSKKRERSLKDAQKLQKELAKKKAEEKKKKAEDKPSEPNVQAADDALMAAESEDDDDDIHGEGSLSQQQDIQVVEEQHIEDIQDEEAHPDAEEDYGEQDGEEDEMEDEEGAIIQQQIEGNALMVDEDEEEEDEIIAVEEHDEEGDEDQDEDASGLFEDEMDFDLPSPSEDLGMLFAGIGNRNRGGRPQAGQRDILFNIPESGAQGERMRVERPGRGFGGFGYEIRFGSNQRAEGQQNFGPNWSQEEEEVSQTLRNLRGLTIAPQEPAQRQGIPQPPGRNAQQESCRYRIELEICKQFNESSQVSNAKKSIEQIKVEQQRSSNNQVSSIFEILKPIDLQGLCSIAQQIDQEFLKGVRTREDLLIEEEKTEKKERLEKIKRGEELTSEETKAQQLLDECEYADEEDSDDGTVLNVNAAPFIPSGLFRDYADGRGEPELSRLMDMRMDIERLLHAQIYDPSMPAGFEDDPLGLGSIFGVPPGLPPRQHARERERVNQANAQRVAREQAVNWDSSLYRAPEISAQENTQNLMQALIDGGNVVYEVVEQPEPVSEAQPSGSASSSVRSPSQQRSQQEQEEAKNSQRQEAPLPHLRDINSVLADLQMGQNSPNTQAIQGDGQQALNSFFRSLNEGGAQQQPNPQPPQQPLVHPQLPHQVDGEALLGGMGGINQALDEIRDEMQNNFEQLNQAVDRVAQPQPVVQEEVLGSALLDDEPQQEEVKQEQVQAEVERTYGFPNSLLRENDIDPEMLHEFPEELRVEILSTIQDQLEQWERDNLPNQPPSEQPMSQDNPVEQQPGTQVQVQVPAQAQSQAEPAQPLPAQPEADQPAQEEMDPEVAQAIAMGLDPDFIANIPPEMRRELILNESFRAANTGAPIPPPVRAPEAMDVASIIATAQDPMLRREMLQNLTAEQIDQLPPALRGEAENLRRGRGPGLFAPRPPRNNIEQMMMGDDRDLLERQMGDFLHRYNRNYPEGDPIKKQAPDPSNLPFDVLMIDHTFQLDQDLQDKALESEKMIDNIQSQMFSSDSSNNDQLLKHILTAICLNSNVKADIIQLLRLILKYKVDNGYPCRNQVVNALTFVMKISAKKDTQRLLNLFEIEIPEHKKATFAINDLQWNHIFLTVTGVLRVLIDNNKKLIMHMLKCLIQREDYFVSKGDHLISSHSKVLLNDSENIPPLAEIIQIMREQSEEHHTLSKKLNHSDLEKKAYQDQLVRIRNVKLLIQDAFKQFDLLFKELDFQNKNGAPQGINLGELSTESVKSLTDLLYLPSIDKKLLTALGDFMFRLSNLSDTQKCQEKNLRNWAMISKQCVNIGKTNITDLNNLMLDALMAFGSFDVQNIDLNRVSSQLEQRSLSQMSSGPNNDPSSIVPLKHKKITPEQEKDLSDFLTQFKMDCAPIKHILSLNSFFFAKFTEEKEKLEKKEERDEAMIRQKMQFIQDIKVFFKSEEVSMLVTQINKVLIVVQQSGSEQIEHVKALVNLVFDCFMPEMHDEVVKSQKTKEKRDEKEVEDSKYVSMESIPKILSEENQAKQDAIMEGETSSLIPTLQTTVGSKRSKKFIFRDVKNASQRLTQFNNFCLQNQQILNNLVKSIYGNQNQRERDRREESKSKDIATVSEYIKFMPNLLDFENKRMYFKKEIKKMKRNVNAKSLILNIRRNEIFMDAYSQLHYLSPNELKGKISVEFSGERGQDVGGLTRDFFIELSREMFNQNYSLFKNSDNGSTYMPNPKSDVQVDHLRYFKFIGRVIGKALFEGCNLECYFVRSMYKMMIGQRLNFKDLEDYDNNLYTGLNWCLQPTSDVETLYESFSTQLDFFGRTEEIDLVPGGRDIDVTNENKEYYVERKAYFHLYKSVQKQMDAFLEGFYELIPQELVSIFTYKELELLISGLPDYQISDLKANTNYNGYNRNSPQIVWFWEIMEELDRTEKGNLLQFVTGSSKVPVEGFALLQGMNGPEKFQITRIVTNDNMRLPQGHTCFNQLDLPEYASKEIMRERLMWAIKETAGFGFA